MRRYAQSAVVALMLAAVPWAALAQNGQGKDYVSREEYEKLKSDFAALKAELAAMKRQPAARPVDVSNLATKDELESVRQECTAKAEKYSNWLESVQPGTTKFLLAGDAGAGYVCQKGSDNTFFAGYSPLLLWQINEKLFFEGGLDISLNGPDPNGSGSGTEVDLSLANINYNVNDWLTLGGGLFTVQFSNYHTHLDPRWINKLPDDPLAFGDDGIAPGSAVGVYATGAFPVKSTVVNYAVYLSNGPTLVTDDPDAAGSLNFDNFNDVNHNKAVGGRIGFLPIPGLELGYSVQYSKVNPDGFDEDVHALLQAVDWNFVRECDEIKGKLTLRGSYVWSNVSSATYDPTGANGFGPLRFNNDRNGGFLEVAYRPTKISNKILQNLEFVGRYDRLDVPDRAPGGGLVQRWTPGVDYWLTPRTVLKFAYEINNISNGPDDNAFVFQLATGM